MELRRHPYSDLIKKATLFAVLPIMLVSSVYFVLALTVDGRRSTVSMTVFACAVAVYVLAVLCTHICDQRSAKSILFSEEGVRYGNRYIDLQEASLRYFRFYLSVFDPALELPKLCINADGRSLVCYLSRRDIRKLKVMGYRVSEI